MQQDDIRLQLEQMIAKAHLDYCEIRFEHSRNLLIQFLGKELDQVRSTELYGGNVRALSQGGWGFAAFNNLEDLEQNFQLACDQAEAAGKVMQGTSQVAEVPTVVDDVCPTWTLHPEAIALDEKIRIMQHYHQLVLSYENIPSATVNYQERCTTLWFVNSEGTSLRQEKVDLGMGVMSQGRKGDVSVSQMVGAGSSLGFDVALGLNEKIHAMCLRTQQLLDAPSIKAGVYTVVCDPGLTGLFVHEAFGHLSEADDLCRSPEFLKSMELGRVLGKPILNIYDTGDIMTSRGGLVYDDEGVLCRRADLVKEGVLVGRLHNRWSAAVLGEEVTGNARALTYTFPPITRMRNTCIGAGESTFEEMIKDIELGVFALGSGGGETNGEVFNFAAGYAYMIRDGQLAELVRDVKLMGNVFTTMENIDMIGSESDHRDGPGGCGKGAQAPLPTSGYCPHIRIQNVVIGGVKE